jgi:hypothetical protein
MTRFLGNIEFSQLVGPVYKRHSGAKAASDYGFTPEVWDIWVSAVLALSIVRCLHPANAPANERALAI